MIYKKISKQNLIWHLLGAVIIILSVYLRFSGIGYESLWFDEGYTYAVSQLPFDKLITPFDVHPPLFYIVESFFVSPGVSEELLRLPSVLASTLSVMLIYVLANILFGARGAVIAVIFIGLSFTHLTYSANARNYAMLLLFFSIACFSLAKLYEYSIKDIWPKYKANALLISYFISAVACLYTHNISVIHLTVLNIVVLIFSALNWRTLKRKYIFGYIILNLGIFICWMPWLSVLIGTTDEFGWLTQPSIIDAARQALSLIGPKRISLWLVIPNLLLLAVAMIYTFIKSDNFLKIIILTTIIGIPMAVFSVGYIKPLYMERTILPALFGFALCLGFFISKLRGKILPLLITIFFTLSCGLSAFEYHIRTLDSDNVGGRLSQNWRDALHSGNKNEIFIIDSFSIPVASYYVSDKQKINIYDNGQILPATLDSWKSYFTSPIKVKRAYGVNFAGFLRQEKNYVKEETFPKNITVIKVKVFTKESRLDPYNSYLATSDYEVFLLKNGYELKETVDLAGLTLERYILKL